MNTLNIESDSVRLLSLKGREVKKWGEVPVPPGLIKDTRIIDTNSVAGIITGLFKGLGVSRRHVIVGMNGFRSIVRFVTLPRLKASQVEEAVMWAAHKEMPVPLDTLYVSWQLLDRTDSEQNIFILGTPRDILDALNKTLKAAGIRPKAIDSKPLALGRLIDRDRAIIIDLENESISTVLKVNGTPAVMQTVVIQPGNTVIDDRIKRLTDDLFRAVEYYNKGHSEQPIGPDIPVYLTGGMVNDGMADLVRDSTNRTVMTPESLIKVVPEMSLSKYAVNMGLYIRGLSARRRNKKPANKFSLRPNIKKAKSYSI